MVPYSAWHQARKYAGVRIEISSSMPKQFVLAWSAWSAQKLELELNSWSRRSESPFKSAVPNWEAKGYTRMFFSKSAQLFWNLWLAKNTENRSVQGILMKALTRARVRKS